MPDPEPLTDDELDALLDDILADLVTEGRVIQLIEGYRELRDKCQRAETIPKRLRVEGRAHIERCAFGNRGAVEGEDRECPCRHCAPGLDLLDQAEALQRILDNTEGE